MRPDWDNYFMNIAHNVATRSTCDRAHVGTVLVRDKRILSTGFNGSPSGLPHCDDAGHLLVNGHCVRTIHAEANAIIQSALHGISTKGAICYVTHFPCLNCTKMLINSGVTRIVFSFEYNVNENAIEFFNDSNVELCHLEHETSK
ncbi:MAG: cytidine/deoxycytidylate deaminase family protein [Bacteroidetes bacterium]|nr:cytidine/deoxycytidylate deaminase family protein [Bacteroidota bacterium]